MSEIWHPPSSPLPLHRRSQRRDDELDQRAEQVLRQLKGSRNAAPTNAPADKRE